MLVGPSTPKAACSRPWSGRRADSQLINNLCNDSDLFLALQFISEARGCPALRQRTGTGWERPRGEAGGARPPPAGPGRQRRQPLFEVRTQLPLYHFFSWLPFFFFLFSFFFFLFVSPFLFFFCYFFFSFSFLFFSPTWKWCWHPTRFLTAALLMKGVHTLYLSHLPGASRKPPSPPRSIMLCFPPPSSSSRSACCLRNWVQKIKGTNPVHLSQQTSDPRTPP